MRKFTLLFALVAFTSFIFAQDACELTEQGPVKSIDKSVVAAKDAGDVYWSEDFDSVRWYGTTASTMPTFTEAGHAGAWSVMDNVGENFYWIWSMEGPKGRYTSPNGGVNTLKQDQEPANWIYEVFDDLGGTGSNGFMMLNGDWYNTDEAGQLTSNIISMDSYVQVTGIDLSEAIGATLKYNQMYRWCCSGGNQLSVFVASDYDATLPEDQQTPHWIELDSRGLLAAVNDHTSEIDRQIQFDISAIAAGQSNLTMRFHKIGASHYYWMIDDIKIVEPNAYDVVATRAWWYYDQEPYTGEGADPNYDWTGGYTKIPVDQVQEFVGFQMAVNNFGLANLEDVKLNVQIYKDGAEEFNETGLGKAMDSGAKDTVVLNTPYFPEMAGSYQVSSTVIFEEDDQDPANNAFSYDFEVNEDGVYSRVYDAPYPLRVMTGAWVGGGNPGDAIMTMFEIHSDSKINSVTTYFWRNDADEQIADILAGNFSMIGRLYGADEETGEPVNTPIISTELRLMDTTDFDQFITMDFLQDGEAEYLTPGRYFVGIETYTSSLDIDFEIGEDKRLQQPGDNAFCWFSGELGYIDSNPVIEMNIVPTIIPDNMVFNVTIPDSVEFDPETDVVYISGDFAGWAEPGSDEAFMLTDDDGDMTYTLSTMVDEGDIAYKYFINAGWDGGEWAGDPNRVYTVVSGINTVDDVFGVYDISVETLDITNVSIYPNPVNDELNITNMNGVDRIVISNIIGQEVMNLTGFERNVTVNTSNLENGVYIVTFIDAHNNMQSARIIKR